jgi:hypothetical protein
MARKPVYFNDWDVYDLGRNTGFVNVGTDYDRGVPKEVLTDNGRQYTNWRGKTRFEQELEKDRVKHIRSRPQQRTSPEFLDPVNGCSAAADRLTPFKKFLRSPKIGNGSTFSNI